jgi:hypothetical protein
LSVTTANQRREKSITPCLPSARSSGPSALP